SVFRAADSRLRHRTLLEASGLPLPRRRFPAFARLGITHPRSVTLRDVPSYGCPCSLASSPSPQKGHPCKRSSSSRPLCGSRSHPARSTAPHVRSLRRHIAQRCPTGILHASSTRSFVYFRFHSCSTPKLRIDTSADLFSG